MLQTRFTKMFGLDYPIMSAPMTSHSGGTRAAAVSAAGGLGSFGGLSDKGPAFAKDQIALVRAKTDRPFGVGFITHFLPAAKPILELALEERVPVIAFSFANPAPYAQQAKDTGAKVICQVQTIDAAQQAIDAGADVLVAQGNEAGGHTGIRPLLPFLSEVLDAWPDIPVLAAGGMATGRALAGILAMGADGAWMGTPLVATYEAVEVADAYKRKIVDARAEDSVFTRVFDLLDEKAWGMPPWPAPVAARVILNETVEQWQGREDDLAAHIDDAAAEFKEHLEQDEMRWRPIYAGPSAGTVRAVRSAAEVIREVCDDAERILRDRSRELLT